MLSRLRGLRCALPGVFALAGVAISLTCQAQLPTTTTQNSTAQALIDTNWSGALTAPQFNSSLGTLTSVTVTLNWSTMQSVVVSNSDGAKSASANGTEQGVYADDSVSVSATLPNGVILTGAPPDLIVGALATDPNAVLVQAPSGSSASNYSLGGLNANSTFTAGPVNTNKTTVSATYTDNATLAAYIGTGSVSFTAAGKGAGNQTDSGGNTTWTITTQAGASITIAYTYTPVNNTPQGCIQGTVWGNKAGDGYCGHPTEVGIGAGVTVDVYNTAGVLVGTAKTAADGTYEVTGLLPSTTYTVMIVRSSLPKGYTLSCSYDCESVTTPGTGCATSVDFAAVQSNTGCTYNTFCQQDWQHTDNCNDYTSCLHECFSIVYPEGNCSIGGSIASCQFGSCNDIEKCLVHNGANCPLPRGCTSNPRSYCNLGQLCGETLCCKLNCDFSDAGIFCSGFKNLTIQSGKFRGCTVSQVCNAANCYLNGDSSLPNVPRCSGDDLCQCLSQVNACCAGSCGNNGGSGFCK